MRSAILNGRDFNELGAIELVAEGPCAIAISRGGAAKTYSHTEPNEDACLFAFGPGGALIAVADGHHGAMGAEIAMRHLLEQAAPDWTGVKAGSAEALAGKAREALSAINLAILSEAERCKLAPSPTTLCIALVRPDEDLLLHASVGDSHIFWTRDAAPVDLAWAAQSDEQPAYLGYPPTPEREAKRRIACETLAGTRSLVLVTDGFSEAGIGHPVPETELHAIQTRSLLGSNDLRPIETCRGVAESTLSIQRKHRAGDNLGCAVWIPS
ncbi:MAG: protein phosphatase 2C domain-containing protein [Deltaproteobacteria bacterium]|nr:protein phosphatase 2C domain-containing protein [Deltaproteobacteria bacterium]MBW2723697.1 protein phosphatase 2C domain-containing protein [Deltaproteobacteria bacterium]